MKFGHLIEYNIRNTFLEKSYTKCDVKTIPRPFSKKIKIGHIPVFSYCIPSLGLSKCIEIKLQTICCYII